MLAKLVGLSALSLVPLALWHVVARPAALPEPAIAWVEGKAVVVRGGEGLERYLCPSRAGQPHSAEVAWAGDDLAYWSPLDSAICLVEDGGARSWLRVTADERWVFGARRPVVCRTGDLLTAWFVFVDYGRHGRGQGDWEWSLWRTPLGGPPAGRPSEVMRFAWPMPPKEEMGIWTFGEFVIEPPVALAVTEGWAVYRRPNGLLVTTATGQDTTFRTDPEATVREALWEPKLRRLWTVEAVGALPPDGHDRLVLYRNDGKQLTVVTRPRYAQLQVPLGTLSPERLDAVRRLGRSVSVTLTNVSAEMVSATVFYGAVPDVLGPVDAHGIGRFRDVLASTGPPVRLAAKGHLSGHEVSWLIDPQRLKGQNLSVCYRGRSALEAPTNAGH
ncbi:MAG: hypothetical protein HUU35_03660 [Armatimonadetes bacterium]|nr:hypothetical protein [Armatimonadota bacterium]